MSVTDLIAVGAAAALELWAAVPLGLALRLPVPVVGAATGAGATLGLLAVLAIGAPLRAAFVERHLRHRRAYRRVADLMDRRGVVAMGLLAPVLVGAPLSLLIGLALGARTGRLFLWALAGVWLWTAALCAVAALGLARFLA